MRALLSAHKGKRYQNLLTETIQECAHLGIFVAYKGSPGKGVFDYGHIRTCSCGSVVKVRVAIASRLGLYSEF